MIQPILILAAGTDPTVGLAAEILRCEGFPWFAERSLEGFDEAPPDGYIPQVFITIGYSYCIVTAEGHFSKIYIVDWDYGQRESGAFFAWIRFDWIYQDDGSRTFGDTVGGG